MNKFDLSEFAPIPNHPSYLMHRDGRVYSLRTDRIMSEQVGGSLVWRRVAIDGGQFRVRDLVALIHGTTEYLSERTEAEYERIERARQKRRDELERERLASEVSW